MVSWQTAQYIDGLLLKANIPQKEWDKINDMLNAQTMEDDQAEGVIQYLQDNQIDTDPKEQFKNWKF